MLPLVSIIVPAYNRSQLIIETLDSIVDQTYRSLELIIIDDGSHDDTKIIVDDWLKKHSSRFNNVVFHTFSKNKGKSEAVNYGFDIFNGDFAMVFDSDDLLLKDAITNEIDYLNKHPTIDCLCAGAYVMKGNVRSTIQFHPFREQGNIENIKLFYGDFFLKGNPVISSTVMMKRSVVKNTGYLDSVLRITHDWDYWIRVTQKFNFGFLNVPVMYYRENADGSISQNKFTLFMEVMRVISKYKSLYERPSIAQLVLQQIKYHLWLAKNDGNMKQFLKIAVYGIHFIIRYTIIGK